MLDIAGIVCQKEIAIPAEVGGCRRCCARKSARIFHIRRVTQLLSFPDKILRVRYPGDEIVALHWLEEFGNPDKLYM